MGLKLLLMVIVLGLLHPIHVSVTDVEHDQERKALEFTSRVFLDDIELHIRFNRNEPYLDITQPNNGTTTDQLIKTYFEKRMSVEVNGKPKEVDYVGHEIDGDAVNIYYQVLGVKKLKSLKMTNQILLDFYDDQVNMVHFKADGGLKSMKMTPDEPESTLNFTD